MESSTFLRTDATQEEGGISSELCPTGSMSSGGISSILLLDSAAAAATASKDGVVALSAGAVATSSTVGASTAAAPSSATLEDSPSLSMLISWAIRDPTSFSNDILFRSLASSMAITLGVQEDGDDQSVPTIKSISTSVESHNDFLHVYHFK
ncbi:hypothetical protein Taro_021729 [Colocasia esculenta]|uniref:Uncharacterized protein n=1 Tax=Colocasia esculenta TaxID=4460 RepID=A0A843V394_COLES|nr:hypothetical protein [Colocasia esculenta]